MCKVVIIGKVSDPSVCVRRSCLFLLPSFRLFPKVTFFVKLSNVAYVVFAIFDLYASAFSSHDIVVLKQNVNGSSSSFCNNNRASRVK